MKGVTRFEWDDEKDKENQAKHNVSFSVAQHAFLDPKRIIVEDVNHSNEEKPVLLYRARGRWHIDGEIYI